SRGSARSSGHARAMPGTCCRRRGCWSIIETELSRARTVAAAEGKAEGKAEGNAEGKAEGKAEGRAEGKADAILTVLRGRGLRISSGMRAEIRGATEERQLDASLRGAATG